MDMAVLRQGPLSYCFYLPSPSSPLNPHFFKENICRQICNVVLNNGGESVFSNILPQWEEWLGVHMISLAQVLMPLLTTSPSYSINGLHFESHDTREGKTHAWDEDFYDADGKTSDDKTFLKASSPHQRR